MEQRVFAFSLIIKGTLEKVLQFIMPLVTIYKQNFCLQFAKKCIFEHYREFQTIMNLLIDVILVMEIFF
jgi:hypothetical protein